MRTRLFMSVAVAVLAAGLVLVPAPPAAAYHEGSFPTATSAYDSQPGKIVSVGCPAGQVPTGGGASLDTYHNNVHITAFDFDPNDASKMYAIAQEGTAGYGGSWSLTVQVICSDPPPGYEVVKRAASFSPTSTTGSTWASCPAGKKVIGAGGFVLDFYAPAHLLSLKPWDSLSGVSVGGVKDPAGTTLYNWAVSATAICANATPSLERLEVDSPGGSASTPTRSTLPTFCPFGKRLLGTGFDVFHPAPASEFHHILINGFPAITDPVFETSTFSASASEDPVGTGAGWWLRSYGICVSPSG